MNKQEYEQAKQILDNNPDIDNEYVFAAIAADGKTELTRSLSDLQTMVTQYETIEKLKAEKDAVVKVLKSFKLRPYAYFKNQRAMNKIDPLLKELTE